MLKGKKIILGVTGSIAAYKSPLIVRQLAGSGAEVKVILTPAAEDFVSKLTLSTLSKNKVFSGLFEDGTWTHHVDLGRWADLMLIAPLSCNTLAKMASGLCDNLLLATYLSAACPVMVAPAMDEDMWRHPSTVRNVETIRKYGNRLIEVAHGELASGLIGFGRMEEPELIVNKVADFFNESRSLAGKKVLITAGPTYEAIDPVRFIGNHSSGKMGFALAEEMAERGAGVILISGPVSISTFNRNIDLVRVDNAESMYKACMSVSDYDIAILAAAVADYKPVHAMDKKIKKTEAELSLPLKRTEDILMELGKRKTGKQVLVGFALETSDEKENARKKLDEKNADLVILNSLNDDGAGFMHDTNKVTLFFRNGNVKELELQSKKEIAKKIIDSITELVP